jgi:hypothetical protein
VRPVRSCCDGSPLLALFDGCTYRVTAEVAAIADIDGDSFSTKIYLMTFFDMDGGKLVALRSTIHELRGNMKIDAIFAGCPPTHHFGAQAEATRCQSSGETHSDVFADYARNCTNPMGRPESSVGIASLAIRPARLNRELAASHTHPCRASFNV